MSTIFPLSASVNQIFQGYRYNGEKWELIGIDLTADYPEIVDGKISASVIPDTFATVAYVDQEVGDIDLSPYLTISNASVTYATKTELDNIDLSSASAAAVTYLVDSAPATLDTLNELAAALNDDSNFAGTVTTALSNKLNIDTASATYLTQLSASTTYATKSELENIDALPDQTGNEYKYLYTNGASASWEFVPTPTELIFSNETQSNATGATRVNQANSWFLSTNSSFSIYTPNILGAFTSFIKLGALTYPGTTKYLTANGGSDTATADSSTVLLPPRSINLVEIDLITRINADQKNSIPAGAKTWKWTGSILVDDNNSTISNSVGTIVGSSTSNVQETSNPSMSGFSFNIGLGSATPFDSGNNYAIPLQIDVTAPSNSPSPAASVWTANIKLVSQAYT